MITFKKSSYSFSHIIERLKIKKLLFVWDSSLSVIGLLGLLLLFVSYFINKNIYILMFGQIASTIAQASVFFFSYILLIKKVRKPFIILTALGSLGLTFGQLTQIMSVSITETSTLLHIASIILSIGIILYLNKIYKDVQNIKSSI